MNVWPQMRQRVKIVIKEEIVRELYAIAGEDAVQTAEPMKIIRPSVWAVRQIISSLLIQKKKSENRGSLRRKRDPVVRHRKRQQSRCK